jgi:hypothetical protein
MTVGVMTIGGAATDVAGAASLVVVVAGPVIGAKNAVDAGVEVTVAVTVFVAVFCTTTAVVAVVVAVGAAAIAGEPVGPAPPVGGGEVGDRPTVRLRSASDRNGTSQGLRRAAQRRD